MFHSLSDDISTWLDNEILDRKMTTDHLKVQLRSKKVSICIKLFTLQRFIKNENTTESNKYFVYFGLYLINYFLFGQSLSLDVRHILN